jgi:uncharacterized membrane protein
MRITDSRITSTVALVAASVWLGGLLALGAIVAPLVFTMIPRPDAADVMTLIFQRFDRVAVISAVVILSTEAWRAAGRPKISRSDFARAATAAIAGGLAVVEALWITPAIVGLHRGGAALGLGAAGIELERMHRLAETCGKAQVAFVLLLIGLEVATLSAPSARETRKIGATGGGKLSPGEAAHGA